MKTGVYFLVCAVLLFGLTSALYAQGAETERDYYSDGYSENDRASSESDTATPSDKIFVSFNEGATASWLTRIITKTERSNFVFKDFLPGLYFTMDMHNIKYVIPTIRLAAYYPLISTFNDMPQLPNNPLHFGVDLLTGVKFQVFDVKYMSINLGAAVHMFFLNAERWNYLNLGGAALASIEVPLTTGWTLLIGGYASLDNGNLGTNRLMEPFDIAWQYQVDLGVRYSGKKKNATPIFSNLPTFSWFDTKSNKSDNKADQTDYYDENENPSSDGTDASDSTDEADMSNETLPFRR